MEEIIELSGKEKGGTSIILVGVHGNETCGPQALDTLLPYLSITAGKVIFIYANPRAIMQGARQTEANLNRMFKPDDQLTAEQLASYEYRRAQELKPYLEQADVLLDIHSSSNPDSVPFIICERNGFSIAQSLPGDRAVFGFDQVEPGGTDYYMNSIGKIGLCIECGYSQDPRAVTVAKDAITNFLTLRGHIQGPVATYRKRVIQMYQLYISKTDRLTLAEPFADFAEINKGKSIALDGDTPLTTEKDSIILFAQNCGKVGEEAFLLGEWITYPDDTNKP